MAWETFSGQSTQTASQDDWRNSILGFIDFTAAEPATPASSDRYVNTTTGVSNVTAQSVTANHVYQWNGASWTETVNEGHADIVKLLKDEIEKRKENGN